MGRRSKRRGVKRRQWSEWRGCEGGGGGGGGEEEGGLNSQVSKDLSDSLSFAEYVSFEPRTRFCHNQG